MGASTARVIRKQALIRFRLGTIPVEIHATHLLISGLISWSFLGYKAPGVAWPRNILSNDLHPQHTPTLIFVTVSWALLVSFSVLVHELGHAVAARIFGAKPSIQLIGLGGRTTATGVEQLEWWQDVLFTLAGPSAGLALGVFAGLVALVGGSALPDPVRYFATGLALANLFWTVLNLLPISTLDGGRITTVVLTRVMGRPGFVVAQLIALVLAAVVLFWAVVSRQPFLAVLVALMVMRTFANLSAYQRGELPAGNAAHPLTSVVERAEALYRERKLTEAELIASGVVEAAETPSLLRSRAHMLLGWIALKQGSGRRALDHFSQVQGLLVPAHALAAGFSLIGDETRAIPLWAQAAQVTGEEVVMDEFAGALIRGGREKEARQLPGVRMARAFAAAERVHYVRKEFDQAAQAAEAAFREEPSPALAYAAACAWAQANRPEDALRWLTLAAQNGYRDADEARSDPDLKALRGKPEFEGWLASLSHSAN
jgi:Zn-dependent protease